MRASRAINVIKLIFNLRHIRMGIWFQPQTIAILKLQMVTQEKGSKTH